MYEAAFRSTFATPKSIRNAVRGFKDYLSFLEALSIDYMACLNWVPAVFVRQASQQSSAKGLRFIRALKWGNEISGIDTFFEFPLVKAQAKRLKDSPGRVPQPARNVTEKIVMGDGGDPNERGPFTHEDLGGLFRHFVGGVSKGSRSSIRQKP